MSVGHLPERPVFNTIDSGMEIPESPPISRLAIVALGLGLISLLAALTVSLLPLAITSMALSAGIVWHLSRNASVGGLKLAQAGLCLAILGGTCGVVYAKLRDSYLANQAESVARTYLKTLGEGKVYEAYELTFPEGERQIAGTDLKTYHEQVAPGEMKEKLLGHMTSPVTAAAGAAGESADWRLATVKNIRWSSSSTLNITVIMVDRSGKSDKRIEMELFREQWVPEGKTTPSARWYVANSLLEKT